MLELTPSHPQLTTPFCVSHQIFPVPPPRLRRMQSTLSRYYVVEGIRISLDVLKALADDLPAPASSIINLAQQILAIAEVCTSSIRV